MTAARVGYATEKEPDMKLFFAVLLLAATVCAQEPAQLKVYQVHYADPASAVEIIKMMMPSTNGLSIQAVDRKLAVRGTAEQHDTVEMMLRELDKPPKNVQINVEFDVKEQSSDREAGIRPKGPIVIRDGEIHGSLEGRFSSRSTTSSENVLQMLVAMDGRSASLRVGETVPYLAWLTEYGSRHGYIRETHIEWRDVGSFLAVVPEIIGDGPMIRIRLIPELSGRLADGTAQTIRFTEVATEVIARDGQPVSIGGFTSDQEFYSKFLIGRSGGSESSVTDITLTPRILN
jgi:type II secretory pathway component GspD/PulD (secretin)